MGDTWSGADLQKRFGAVDELLNTQSSVLKTILRQLDTLSSVLLAVCEKDPALSQHVDKLRALRGSGVPRVG